MTQPITAAPLDNEAARAETEGDYARARALSQAMLAATTGAPHARGKGSAPRRGHRPAASSASSAPQGGVGQERTFAAAQNRLRRLGTDAMAWQVGLGALLAYTAAWIYALTQNR